MSFVSTSKSLQLTEVLFKVRGVGGVHASRNRRLFVKLYVVCGAVARAESSIASSRGNVSHIVFAVIPGFAHRLSRVSVFLTVSCDHKHFPNSVTGATVNCSTCHCESWCHFAAAFLRISVIVLRSETRGHRFLVSSNILSCCVFHQEFLWTL